MRDSQTKKGSDVSHSLSYTVSLNKKKKIVIFILNLEMEEKSIDLPTSTTWAIDEWLK